MELDSLIFSNLSAKKKNKINSPHDTEKNDRIERERS